MEPVKVIVIGAGARGRVYADFAKNHKEQMKVVAVAEPDKERRERFAADYGIEACNCYDSWEKLLGLDRCADAAFICTLDELHYEPCMMAIDKGYHVLLEKPMSPNPKECIEMERAAREKGVSLAVCHVLRYTPFFSKCKELIDDNKIGRVMAIEQTEHVGYWHQAHSFVRGNWRNSKETAPMILAKCCHDLDIIAWLAGTKCERIASFGSLSHFTAENAPKDAPLRCLDDCPHSEECLYYAPKLYMTEKTGWPTDTICVDMSLKAREEALRKGPYGRCVYHCDNDVVDHQMVLMEFEHGITASLTMTAFTPRLTRTLRIMGTSGIIEGDLEESCITLHRFGEEPVLFNAQVLNANAYGHGGGDVGLMKDFVLQIQGGGESRTNGKVSLESHIMAFAAETARVENRQITIKEYIQGL